MNWGTAIVGAISILIVIAPLVIIHYNRVKKENQMLQSLNVIAQQHNCEINQHELCSNFIIGLDESKNFVFFFKQKMGEAIYQFIDLSEIQTCHAVKKARIVKNENESVEIIERVELSFTPANKSKGETRLELYDEEANMLLSGELQFVNKWSKQINDRLKNKKK